MSYLLALFSIYVLATVGASGAAEPAASEAYWNKVFPSTTPMPKAIKDLLPQSDVYTFDKKSSKTAKEFRVIPQGLPHFTVYTKYTTRYGNDRKVHYDPSITIFFKGKDLRMGNKMTLSFADISSSFISRKEAKSIPFTSAMLPEILNRLSIKPKSIEAESTKNTLLDCEERAAEGEIKSCATSLESMVEFTTATLGTRNVIALSTTANKENSPKQKYEIISSHKISGSNMVACHAQIYAYAVFYCHKMKGFEAYKVSLLGKDGAKVDAIATCHTDTSRWSPNHLAFKILGGKPGKFTICHFLAQYDLVWTPKN